MKDHELRGIVLNHFYMRRGENHVVISEDDFEREYSYSDLKRICKQLEEKGLIQGWHPTNTGMGATVGIGQLSALGADVVEGVVSSPISITFNDNKNINITSSENIQIGNENIQNISTHIEQILMSIENSSATEKEKEEAKSQLRKFLEHPAIVAVIGGLASRVFG